jgi:transcriptional regulator with XRE-family HTH domain
VQIDRSPAQIDGVFCTFMSDDYYFDRWLKEAREKRGWSGPELAERAHTTKQTVSQIERQQPHPVSGAPYRPSMAMVDKLARALGLSIGEARRAAGFAAPLSEVSADELEKDELTSLYFRRKRLQTSKRKAEFQRILAMVDRELDRLIQEEQADKGQ